MTGGNKQVILGIDLGGTHFRCGMVQKDGMLDGFTIEKSEILLKPEGPIRALTQYIEDYIQGWGHGRPLAISIGFPSAISKDKKTVYSSPNLKGFNDLNVVDPLEAHFGMPVFIDNDVNHLLMYEVFERNFVGQGITLGFYVGTGLGNAIFIDHRLLEGKHGVAAELGHIPAFMETRQCGCGNYGCIEMFASGKRLIELKQEHFPDAEIDKIFTLYRNHEEVERFVEAISIPLATEITIFDPDRIVLGGGVINMDSFPREALEGYIYKHTRKPYPANGLDIVYAANSQEIGVKGAALYGFSKYALREQGKEQKKER